jgi:hypothetical protein
MRYKTFRYENSVLDIDAVYIVRTFNGSIDIEDQLSIYRVSKVVHLLQEEDNKPLDTYIAIFKDALRQNYGNIGILEDGCFFTPSSFSVTKTEHINTFFKNATTPWVYHLGCLPLCMLPIKDQHYRVYGINSYACIYSKTFRDITLQQKNITANWDLYLVLNANCFTYTSPLCYSATKHSKPETMELSIDQLISMIKLGIQFLTSDKYHEPFYNLCYFLGKSSLIMVVVLVLALIYVIIYRKELTTFLLNQHIYSSVYGHTLTDLAKKYLFNEKKEIVAEPSPVSDTNKHI